MRIHLDVETTGSIRGQPVAQNPTNSLAGESDDRAVHTIAHPGQNDSGDATLAIPADEVRLAETPPQAGEQRRRPRRVGRGFRVGPIVEREGGQPERATRSFRPPLLPRPKK